MKSFGTKLDEALNEAEQIPWDGPNPAPAGIDHSEPAKLIDDEFKFTYQALQSDINYAKQRIAAGHDIEAIFKRLAEHIHDRLLELEFRTTKQS